MYIKMVMEEVLANALLHVIQVILLMSPLFLLVELTYFVFTVVRRNELDGKLFRRLYKRKSKITDTEEDEENGITYTSLKSRRRIRITEKTGRKLKERLKMFLSIMSTGFVTLYMCAFFCKADIFQLLKVLFRDLAVLLAVLIVNSVYLIIKDSICD